jgi:hypothetical protein
MKKDLKVQSVKMEDGSYKQHVVVPLGLFQENFSKPSGLKAWFSSFFKNKTDIAQDNIAKEDDPNQSTAIDVSSAASGSNYMYGQMQLDNTRLARYEDYETMENESTVLERALSVVTSNTFMSRKGDGESWELKTEDQAVAKVVEGVDERTSVRKLMPSIYRSALQYGDGFEEVVFDRSKLIIDLRWLPPKNIVRNEDQFGRLFPEAAFSLVDSLGANDVMAHLPWWQCIHLRHSHRRGARYGTAMFFPSRRPFRILRPMEDSVALNRIVSGVDRLAITFPVPKNTSAKDRRRMSQEMARNFTSKISVDADGRVDFTRNPMLDTENFFIGVTSDEQAKVERISGSMITDNLKDVEHFQNDMITGTGVPKAYLGLERDVNAKATLSWEDIEFGRQLRWNQQEVAWFLRELYDRQLQVLNMSSGMKVYKLIFPAISFIDEEMLWSVMMMRWKIASEARITLGIPIEWLLSEIVGLDEEAVDKIVNHPDFRLTNTENLAKGTEEGFSTGEATADEKQIAKNVIAQNMGAMSSLQDLKSKIDYVMKHRLSESVEL